MRTVLASFVALLVVVIAPAAYACPMCALNDKAGLGSWFILAGMLGMPFLITIAAILVMRKIGAKSVAETAAEAEAS